MKRRHILLVIMVLAALCIVLAGCNNGSNNVSTNNTANAAAGNEAQSGNAPIVDGTYTAKFKTDNSMFHVNEAYKGRGTLTVKDGKMTLHVTLASKGIVNLFPGTAEDAQKQGAVLLQPTTDTVKYSDGTTDEAYGFDIPVPYLDEEFDCALVGTKGKWYDHKVSVSDPQPVQ